MQGIVVNCGCGRTMNPDGRRGYGAYRCGCGAAVALTQRAPDARRRPCWWYNCRSIAATPVPVALCDTHLGQTIHQLVGPAGYQALWEEATARYVAEHPPESLSPERRVQAKPTWVYFMRREVLIKIGYSNDPDRRAVALGATLLAKMSGDSKSESLLHRKFQHLWVHGEWFRPGGDLIAFINHLRGADDLPAITAEPARDLYDSA